jgi:hypothetical protein
MRRGTNNGVRVSPTTREPLLVSTRSESNYTRKLALPQQCIILIFVFHRRTLTQPAMQPNIE